MDNVCERHGAQHDCTNDYPEQQAQYAAGNRTAAATRARIEQARARRLEQAAEELRDAGYRVVPPATSAATGCPA